VAKVSAAKIKQLFTDYIGIRQQRETFAKREDELKKLLSNMVETQGYTDDKGSEFIDFDAPIEGYAGLKRERRVVQSLDEDKALTIIRRAGLEDSCIRMVPQVNEDAVRVALYDGKLSQDDIDAMFVQRVNYAFIPRKA